MSEPTPAEAARTAAYAKIYSLMYRRLKTLGPAADADTIATLARGVYADTYKALLVDTYGIAPSEALRQAVDRESAAAAEALVRHLAAQQQKVYREVSRLTRGMGREEIRKVRELTRGVPAPRVRTIVAARQAYRERGYSASSVDRRSEAAAASLRQRRAAAIAATESVRWVEGARTRLLAVASESAGGVPALAAVRWVTTFKATTCDRCRDLHKTVVPLGSQFDADGEKVDGPPLHPWCDCTTEYLPTGAG